MARKPQAAPAGAAAQQAEHTRLALVRAALKLFGAQGFDATSTREIAALANANVASITYHFGNKEGLRAAAADHIVETLRAIGGPLLAESIDFDRLTPDEAAGRLDRVFDTMASFMLGTPEAEEIALFILRELSRPTSALDRIYEGMFAPTHQRLCRLWAAATGEPADDQRTLLTIFTLIGQVVYFKVGRAAVLRRMGWDAVNDERAEMIAGLVRDNLAAIIAGRRAAAKAKSGG